MKEGHPATTAATQEGGGGVGAPVKRRDGEEVQKKGVAYLSFAVRWDWGKKCRLSLQLGNEVGTPATTAAATQEGGDGVGVAHAPPQEQPPSAEDGGGGRVGVRLVRRSCGPPPGR